MHFFEPLLCTFYLTNTFNLEYDRAVEMFEKAIRNKCYDAAYDLAEIYKCGQGYAGGLQAVFRQTYPGQASADVGGIQEKVGAASP